MSKSLISDKENAAMSNDTTVPYQNPAFYDEMTDLIRAHAQAVIRQAILTELEIFLGQHDDTDEHGRRHVGCNAPTPPASNWLRLRRTNSRLTSWLNTGLLAPRPSAVNVPSTLPSALKVTGGFHCDQCPYCSVSLVLRCDCLGSRLPGRQYV